MLVDGHLRDDSFQRKTGYVQQQDLHLGTATVREALTFSALLRQPASTHKQAKLDHVDEVIDQLEMREYADAIIGETGEGLNVEQRKRLSIGVELAAKPQLLLFLDEPTSGLDSQTAWSICDLMRKLVDHGQAILCTVHQPSAMLFERFDRVLLLARGGRTVYFGAIGKGSHTMVDYFVGKGASPCPSGTNPAEWMLSTIGAISDAGENELDWPKIWKASPEKAAVDAELECLARTAPPRLEASQATQAESEKEFAASLFSQTAIVTIRGFQHYWRSPGYIYSKAFLGIGSVSRNILHDRGFSALADSAPDAIYWLRILSGGKNSTRASGPAVWHLCPAHDLYSIRGADYPVLRCLSIIVRGSGATIKNLFLGGFHVFQYNSGDSVESGKLLAPGLNASRASLG